jgi:hypothetical protein
MTQKTFTDNVLIDGSQDVEQLRVQGNTTQDQALQTWEDHAGDVLAQVTGDGRLQLGDDLGFSSPDALIEAHRAEASTSKPKRGFHALGQVSDSLTNIAQWIVQELEIWGADSLSALQTALRVRASNLNTGTPAAGAEIRAADIEVINDAAASAAALPLATGLQVAVTNAAGKTITQAVGLHVKMNNAGAITTPYAIFTEGVGAVHLDDYLEMKRPAATPGTPATDYVQLYPKSDGKLYAQNWSGVEVTLGSVVTSGAPVDSPPTPINFGSNFGTQPEGFLGLVDDNNDDSAVYLASFLHSKWWFAALAEAVDKLTAATPSDHFYTSDTTPELDWA